MTPRDWMPAVRISKVLFAPLWLIVSGVSLASLLAASVLGWILLYVPYTCWHWVKAGRRPTETYSLFMDNRSTRGPLRWVAGLLLAGTVVIVCYWPFGEYDELRSESSFLDRLSKRLFERRAK